MVQLWLIFLLSALAIIVSGTKLSEYGDVIAIKTGLGQALVGSILIAGATSLPELITSSTAAILEAPNISMGNVFGSNTFNLMILALVDLIHGSGPFMLKVNSRHILSALLGVLLSSLAIMFIMANHLLSFQVDFFHVGLGGIVILFTYIIGASLTYRYEERNRLETEKEEELLNLSIPLKKAYFKFGLAAVVIVFAGVALSYSGDQISNLTGLEETFMGTILVAAATSLPEVVAAVSAIRINAYDMAVGNVFGSNIFNMAIIGVTDLVYTSGDLLAAVSLSHSVTALLGIILSSIALIGLFYRSEKTFLTVGWDSIAIFGTYFFGAYLLFRLGINF